jgi:PKD repeat protein
LAPLDLVYVCGNKFLVTNSTRSAVDLTYRVVGTNETGALTLRETPGGDPWFSETELETVERGAVELYRNDELVARRRNQGLPCGASPPSLAVAALRTPASAGEWSAPFAWPNVAVHLSLLPTGKVLSFGLSGVPQVWDPGTGSFTSTPSPAMIFCSGHSFLPDGRLLVSGGNNDPNVALNGIPDITIFNPVTLSWSRSTPMRRGRWYPTNTTLANGDVVILGGKDEAGVMVREPEVWSNGALRVLTSAGLSLPLYPRTFLAPDGRVFMAGENPGTRYMDPTGTGLWTTGPTRRYGARDYGAAAMYDDGKILYVGGGRTTNTAEIIDLNSGAPAWRWTGSMAYPRRHLNAIVLPTGEVLVTGGSSGVTFNDYKAPIRAAELWNPATGLWTTLASNTVNRVYHASSILLPDGRILHAGSGDAGPDQRNAELFSPPYLFKGSRPTITAAPSLIGYGSPFNVTTPDAGNIAKVSLIRIGSTTHGFDMNQRFQRLSFTRNPGLLSISAPTSANRTPPGHYLLFILDGNGVPSLARIVKVGSVSEPGSPPPLPPPSSSIALSVTGSVDATKQYMTLRWNGASGPTVDVYRDGRFLRNAPNTGSYTSAISFMGQAAYGYKVCQVGSTKCSNGAAVQFSGRTAPPIPLNVAAWTDPTRKLMDLTWTGASGTTVDVYRNGLFLKNTPNSGRYTTSYAGVSAATYTYKVCRKGTTTCSRVATVRFPAGAPMNVLPTAAFTASCPTLSCVFTDGSTDRDGSVVQWGWSFGDGSSSTLPQPTHSYGAAGTYTVTLAVKDNGGDSGTISKPVTVTAPPPPDQPPVAIFTSRCADLTCTFTDGSTDDGSVTAWSWDFGDNSGSSAIQNPSYAYAAGGSYEVTLTVTDNKGATGAIKHTVTVTALTPPNQPPVADFASSCADLTCTFTDGSTDDGSVTAWSWDFGDNSGSSAIQSPSYTYTAGGSHGVTLTVTDNKGASATVTKTVTVPPTP